MPKQNMHLDLERATCFYGDSSCPLTQGKCADEFCGFDNEYQTCVNKFCFKLCAKCDVLVLDPRPKIQDLEIIYPPKYHSYILTKENKKLFDITFFRKKAALARFRIGFNCKKQEGRFKILDIGCGNGWMLDVLKDSFGDEIQTFGTEINENVVKDALTKGHCVKYGLDPFALFDEEQFEVINITHVIEHLEKPFQLIENCFKLLKPGGILIIETPNYQSLDRKSTGLLNKGSWGGFHYPRHWYLFCEETVKKLASKIRGLEVVKITYFPTPTTWVWSMNNLIRNIFKQTTTIFDPVKIFQNSGVSFLAMAGFYLFDKVACLCRLKTSTFQFVLRKKLN